MGLFARVVDALHTSRQREAERMIRRYQPLVEQAREFDRRRALAESERAASAPRGTTASRPAVLVARSAS
jgi:hypothetical protein